MSLLALAGVAGLAIDLGHLYVVKTEAQTFVDLSALAAVRELDGTFEGVRRARDRVRESPSSRLLRLAGGAAMRIDFSRDHRNWDDQPRSAAGLNSVRVTARLERVELFFLPAVIPHRTASVQAQAAAAQTATAGSASGGLLPFAVLAHDPAPPHFGYHPGDQVTLRWPPPGPNPASPCAADQEAKWAEAGRALSPLGGGYIQDPAREAIREAIEDARVFRPVRIGEPVEMTGGERAFQAESLARRAGQDTNRQARTWAEYSRSPGNGRRVGAVAVIGRDLRVLGFANVFLPLDPPAEESKGLCAEWAGPGGPAPGVVATRLIR